LAAQRELEAAEWPTSAPLRVRMGLHTGPAELAGADYAVAHSLNRVARIMSAAHGGQVVLSAEVAELLHGDLPPDSGLRDLGQHRMKGMTQREHLFQLLAPGLPASFPPLATLLRSDPESKRQSSVRRA
jgi:class 3 adenylate cyclase